MHRSGRRDARRNRDAILAAAVEALTTSRSSVPLHEIARRAGVGQATVYRHFSDRHALAAEVARERLAALEQFTAEHADEPEVLRPLLETVLRTQITMRPLVALLGGNPPEARTRYGQRIVAALAGLFERARVAGLLRPDASTDDLMLGFAMIEGVLAESGDANRAVEIVLDGLFEPTCGR